VLILESVSRGERGVPVNVSHLGDAKDLAKGGLFGLLRRAGVLRGPKLVPLFTRPEPDPDHLRTHLAILGCKNADLLSSDLFPSGKVRRHDYLVAVRQAGGSACDLFLDPDTGIRTGLKGNTTDKKFVTHGELHFLLAVEGCRILIIYDESYAYATDAGKMKAMTERLKLLRQQGTDAFGYFGCAVNLIFLAKAAGCDRLVSSTAQ
jgi:hypothetical protein